MKISQKQSDFIAATKTGKYNEFVLAGGTGSAKTFGILHYLDTMCELLPGVRIGIFRLSHKNIKTNVVPSLRKLWKMKDKNIRIVDMVAKYENGSEIVFGWADITKDPDADNVKGGEYTAIYFNEANQIDKKYIDTARTRIGRWNDIVIDGKEVHIKPMLFLDFNPTDNWVKANYYDKYQAGTLPENVYFQLSLPKDNPFLSEEYFKMLETLPEAEYKRYVLGDWSYSDNPSQIVYYEWLKEAQCDQKRSADLLGIDIAYTGADKTMISFVEENRLQHLEHLNVDITNTTLQAMRIKQLANDLGVLPDKIKLDAIGIGAGVYDALRVQDFNVHKFIASEKADEVYQDIRVDNRVEKMKSVIQFGNKRAEAYWNFRELLRSGSIEVLYDKELWEELTNTEYYEQNGKIYIEEKKSIKKKIHRSPDKADSAVIAFANIKKKKTYGIV